MPTGRTAPARLTVRGRLVLAMGSLAVAAGIVLGAWFSAPQAAPAASSPTQVVVHDGDTLWSVAGQVAPGRDPRAVVADLVRINNLPDVTLIPGQVLRIR